MGHRDYSLTDMAERIRELEIEKAAARAPAWPAAPVRAGAAAKCAIGRLLSAARRQQRIDALKRERDEAIEKYGIVFAERDSLRAALGNARNALIVLSDDTWDSVAHGRRECDELYSWTVGHYRRMRDAAREIDALLGEGA
jgi:hypothetical protein